MNFQVSSEFPGAPTSSFSYSGKSMDRIVGTLSGFDEGLHSDEVLIHVLLGIRAQQRGDGMADGTGGRIVGKPNLDSGVAVFRVESNDARVLNQAARLASPRQQSIRHHLRGHGI